MDQDLMAQAQYDKEQRRLAKQKEEAADAQRSVGRVCLGVLCVVCCVCCVCVCVCVCVCLLWKKCVCSLCVCSRCLLNACVRRRSD